MKAGTIRVFFLISESGADRAARQLVMLAEGLSAERFQIEIAAIGPTKCTLRDELRATKCPIHLVPHRSAVDFSAIRRLRRLVADSGADIVHAWSPTASRLLPLLGGLRRSDAAFRTIVSASAAIGGIWGWATAQAVRRADRVVAATAIEEERLRHVGVPTERLFRIAPGVALPSPPPRDAFYREVDLPPTARFIAACGPLETGPGMKSAVWAFDMLRYEFPDLYLVLFGEGPGRAAIERFGRSLAFDDFRVRFAGRRADLPSLLALAEAVWVTGETEVLTLALEALASGRPVVAWNTPEMNEMIKDGKTGLLVDAGDRFRFSARTHALLRNGTLQSELGAAGQRQAIGHFGARQMIDRYAGLYSELSGVTESI